MYTRLSSEAHTAMRAPNLTCFVTAFTIFLVCSVLGKQNTSSQRIRVVPNETAQRVDISIDGQPFTAYIWPDRLAKPVLFPLRSAKGTLVTRGFPLEPRAAERADHPHHVGLWLNYENVNGIDFWNNSEAIKAEDAPKMGTILHRRIVSARGGDRGELVTESDWVLHAGTTLLRERTAYLFTGDDDS